jgi:hypothetical protein
MRTLWYHSFPTMLDYSRLRAPYSVLRALLGAPDPDHGMDKTSTVFNYNFEGRDVLLCDRHRDDYGEEPDCLTNPRYEWIVSGTDIEPFCRWLSTEVIVRTRSGTGGRALDEAGRSELNKLVASGLAVGEAMNRVRTVAVDAGTYEWPLPEDDATIAALAIDKADKPAPAPKPPPPPAAKPIVRRKRS